MVTLTNEALKARIQRGEMIERPEEMTEEYRYELKRMLLIAGDTEFRSVPMLYSYFHVGVPYRYAKSVLAIAQDEMGHAHIDYRLLEDLGENIEALLFERDVNQWVYPYFFDMPVENWAEIAVAEGLGEYAGGLLVRNIFHHTSYAPWRRALVKVDLEENFHVKFGQALMGELCATPQGRKQVQQATDWMFPLLVEFFGPPAKAEDVQLDYHLKGKGTDGLREDYLEYALPFATSLGLELPARYDTEQKKYVLDFPFPCAFRPEKKQWDFSAPVAWKEVFARWKQRGPMAEEHLRWIRKGSESLRRPESSRR